MNVFFVAAAAAGDGITDDTDALQALLHKLPIGGTLDFGDRTYIVGAALDGRMLANARLVGSGTLKAKDGTDFQFIVDLAGTSGIEIEGLTFDANKTGRRAATGKLSCLSINSTSRCVLSQCTFMGSLGIRAASGMSSIAVSASGGCRDLRVDRCRFLACGITPNDRPSDGIFVRGENCVISNCHAENVTDTAFVLEGCNFSQILNCSGKDCTSIAGMSNDTDVDLRGNVIDGITGTSNYLGSFGGIIAVLALRAGRLVDCQIRNIDVSAATGARGNGAGIYLYGRIDGADVSNISVDVGSTSGIMTHGIVVDGTIALEIRNSRVRSDGIGTCIRLVNASAGIRIERNRLEHGAYGIYADGTSRFSERGNTFANCHKAVGLAGRAVRT